MQKVFLYHTLMVQFNLQVIDSPIDFSLSSAVKKSGNYVKLLQNYTYSFF